MVIATREEAPAAPRAKTSLREVIATEKKRATRRRRSVWLVALAVPVIGAATWFALRPKPLAPGALYRTALVTEGDIVREVRATGRLEAVVTVDVGAEISGRVASVEVDFNDRVKAGQILARFDRAALGAQVAQVEATLLSSRALPRWRESRRQRR